MVIIYMDVYSLRAKAVLNKIQKEERPLIFKISFNINEQRIFVGGHHYAPIKIIDNLNSFLKLSKYYANKKRRQNIIVYRGQTSAYKLRTNKSESLVPPGMRGSTTFSYEMGEFIQRFSGNDELYKTFVRYFAFKERKETRWNKNASLDVLRKDYESFYYNALLQHYGLKSIFLDVTTDPSVALYFANHRQSTYKGNNCPSYKYSNKSYGIIYILEVPSAKMGRFVNVNQNVWTIDLRERITNRCCRPWRQSAFSLAQNIYGARPNIDLNTFANRIKIKTIVKGDWIGRYLEKEGITSRHLFPDQKTDPLYKIYNNCYGDRHTDA